VCAAREDGFHTRAANEQQTRRDPAEPIELLDGELVVVSPQGPDHAGVASTLGHRLARAYGDGFAVRTQFPVTAGEHSLPEPDIAVVRGDPADYLTRHPGPDDTVLLVEVSSTSRRTDQRKALVYAGAGYPVYWRLDLPRRTLEVYERPAAGSYGSLSTRGLDVPVTLPVIGVRTSVAALVR